jgi:hypothetical protein
LLDHIIWSTVITAVITVGSIQLKAMGNSFTIEGVKVKLCSNTWPLDRMHGCNPASHMLKTVAGLDLASYMAHRLR